MKRRPVSEAVEQALRRPPAFPEYGSDLLGLEVIKLMTFPERGLFATLRWYLWANDTIPAEPKLMARLLGQEASDIQAALTGRVLAFFAPVKGQPDRLYCPELAAQMERLVDRRARQLEGTLNSHKERERKAREALTSGGTHDGTQGGTHDGTHAQKAVVSEMNRNAPHGTALGKVADKERPSLPQAANTGGRRGNLEDDPFVAGIEASDAKERAARG